jgi:hypothetical protein
MAQCTLHVLMLDLLHPANLPAPPLSLVGGVL